MGKNYKKHVLQWGKSDMITSEELMEKSEKEISLSS